MRYLALACDYDGTIAHHGIVDEATRAALERLRASGRKLVLVTGRELDDLIRVCPHVDLFERVVAENGALLYDPARRQARPLAEPPPAGFVQELTRRGVQPLSVGRVIVATWTPRETSVFEVIRDMSLELQVIFNKGAVMVLPSGVNKASGLARALEDLALSAHDAVGVGDAENDHAFLMTCECAVAVANALDSVKARVDLVTAADHGAGVAELVDRMLSTDLSELEPKLTRHELLLGRADSGDEVHLKPYGGAVLIAGPSGAGKTTVTTAFLEQLCEHRYQFCVIDPEGDYHELPRAIALRGTDEAPLVDEALQILSRPAENVVVSLVDLRLDDRPAFLQRLLPRLVELRAATARPHWIVIDEAHHLLPSERPSAESLPGELRNLLFITVHPDRIARPALELVDVVVAVGAHPQATLDAFARGRGERPAQLPAHSAPDESEIAWLVRRGAAPIRFRRLAPVTERTRHRRKYAEGELGADKSFYFRGPDGRLNLRAQNLQLFAQLADGVDDDTWLHHLKRHDVSRWFRIAIKDEGLAEEAATIETRGDLSPAESRARIRTAIERRYTTPA
jgi:hydroxymethylpyrimidine pyrophosphatase-like HAD family hydrolase